MEYALMGLFIIFQELFNLLMTLEVADGVPFGGVLVALMILSVFLQNFKMRNDSAAGSGRFKKSNGGK